MKIHCAKKMKAAIAAVQAFNAEHPQLCIDIAPECEDTRGPNYAVCQFTLDAASGNEYFDAGRASDDMRGVIKDAFGKHFTVLFHHPVEKPKHKEGELYLMFHGNSHGEVEAYRYRKPKRR